MYVEDGNRAPNAEIGPKVSFDIASMNSCLRRYDSDYEKSTEIKPYKMSPADLFLT